MAKTECKITREHFAQHARALKLDIAKLGSDPFDKAVLQPHEFKPSAGAQYGSFGWYGNGKIWVDIGGEQVCVQMGITFTVVGSKEVAPAAKAAA